MSKTKTLLAMFMLVLVSPACNTLSPATAPSSSPTTVSVVPTATLVVIVEPTLQVREPELPATDAAVPRVSLEEALTAYNAGAAIFVDVRGVPSYEISHIPGALNIPLGEFVTNMANVNLDKDAWIITYCT